VALLVLLVGACGGESAVKGSASGPSTSGGPPSTGAPSAGGYEAKTSDALVKAVAAVASARRSGADLARLSTGLVHVRQDGFIELVLHTAVPVTAAQVDETRRLGAEVVGTLATPATPGQPAGGLVQLWVPAEGVPAVAVLPWVVAVTLPAYPAAGG
jgi:hypothetical protein